MSTTRTAEPTEVSPPLLEQLSPRLRGLYQRIPDSIDYVWNDALGDPGTERKLFGPDARSIDVPEWAHFPQVIDGEAAPAPTRRKLSTEDESTLFLRYNYARYRLNGLLQAAPRKPTVRQAREMARWYSRALSARATLVRANMALVLAMAKRTRVPNVDFNDLVSEGNMALLRSVEKFDVSRGYKFSTYACRAILKGFNRLATKTGRYRERFPTEWNPEMERSDYDVHKHEMQRDLSLEALRDILSRNRANLTDVERTIVTERFGITSGSRKRTLAEVAKTVGLTNERVRQIQNLALRKLRETMDRDALIA